MKSLRLLKLSLAAAALLVGSQVRSFATTGFTLTDGTYTFTSTTSDHSLDGSTVTISGSVGTGYTLSAWDILDTNQGAFPDVSPSGTLNNFTVTGNNAWSFMLLDSGFNIQGTDSSGTGSLSVNADPGGLWAMNSQSSGVPDASSTLSLIALAVTLLGICGAYAPKRSATRA
jgi:hypothetical protein